MTNDFSTDTDIALGGTFTLPNSGIRLRRLGYGAMQLAGPHVWGPPRDEDAARALLRDVLALGINHIDTADFYGPQHTNRLIREALHPYRQDLTLVTKIGYLRGDDASWYPALAEEELIGAVHANLRHLGLDALPVVNLRLGGQSGPQDAPLDAPLAVLARLQRDGLIRHIGLSNVTAAQVAAAQRIVPIVGVQNQYNLAHRQDDALLDSLAVQGIAFTPFFPLGGFSPLQSSALAEVAAELQATPMQVALAWLLQRAPNVLLIPGTSSIAHLRENAQAVALQIAPGQLTRLNAIGMTG